MLPRSKTVLRSEDRLRLSKRKSRAPQPLSDEQIVAVALELVRREGAEQLSMRKLASELGVTPMAIYYYVPNKDALFDRISDAVLARIPRPTPTGTAWREELAAYTIHGWQLMLEYPGLSQQLAKRPPSVESDVVAQYSLSILLAAGFDRATAAMATTSYHAFMVGVIGLQAQALQRGARSKVRSSPSTVYLKQVDFRQLVEFGIDVFLRGLDGRLRERRRASSPKTARR